MDINLVKWHPYTEENWEDEVFYVEWHSALDGKFSKADIWMIFKAVILVYSKILSITCNVTVSDALDKLHYMNIEKFDQKLCEVFDKLPWGTGIGYSELKDVLSSIMVPNIKN